MSFITSLLPGKVKQKIKNSLGVPNMFWSLQNMKNNGFYPAHIIDIGAYQGEWTKETKVIFPDAKFLMIEAQESKISQLTTLVNQNPKHIQFKQALLASVDGQVVNFNEMETASSVLEEHFETNAKVVQMKTQKLDTLLSSVSFPQPEFIKLDTQGFELEILKGAVEALQKVQAVLMEVSLIDIHKKCPLMTEVVSFMFEKGFMPYDICSFTRRPLDNALWQIDMIFVKREHPLVNNKRWS